MLAAAILGIGAASPASAKAEPVMLEPSSKWNVDFGEEKCRLVRVFGEGENRHVLFFEQWGPKASFGFTASGRGFDRFRANKPVSVRFFRDQEPMETQPFMGTIASFGEAIIYSKLALEEPNQGQKLGILHQLNTARASFAEFVEFKQRNRSVTFKTGELGEAFKVLNQCTQSLISDWGVDVEKHKSATKAVKWTNEQAIGQRLVETYPRAALRKGEQGIMRMRLKIDETGKMTDCVINQTTINKSLKSPACREMAKAEFEPALDANGLPMASYYLTAITYKVND